MCFIQTIRRLLEDLSTWSYLTAKDVVEDGCIVVEHVDIDSMLANPLTKGLNPVVFKWGVENMGIVRFFLYAWLVGTLDLCYFLSHVVGSLFWILGNDVLMTFYILFDKYMMRWISLWYILYVYIKCEIIKVLCHRYHCVGDQHQN